MRTRHLPFVLLAAAVSSPAALADFVVNPENVSRHLLSESEAWVFIPGTGAQKQADDADEMTFLEMGLFSDQLSTPIESIGFVTDTHAAQHSVISSDRIHGAGDSAYESAPTPENGLFFATGISEMIVHFDIVEPTVVEFRASAEVVSNFFHATSAVYFTGPDGFSIAATTSGAGFDEADFSGVLTPGSYTIQTQSATFGSCVITPEHVSVGGAWSFDLQVQGACSEDLTGDGMVDSTDLFELLGAWGTIGGASDLAGDSIVDSTDLFALLGAWGACPE